MLKAWRTLFQFPAQSFEGAFFMRRLRLLLIVFVAAVSLSFMNSAQAQSKVTLILGSWRTEDIDGYGKILAAFNKANPNIEVKFQPTLNTAYNAQLQTALAAGKGPDLITCRPFDISLINYQAGYLMNIKDLPGLEHYTDVAKSAWATDNKDAVFCVPMASVIHGFIYNQDIFDKVGVKPPTTETEFFAVLDKIKAAGITPLDITSKDSWTTATMGFENIGVNYWDGENGRLAIIQGKAKVTDAPYVNALKSLARWQAYMPDGHESIGYADAQQIFPLGKAAIYPSGSWEIPQFTKDADFKMGAFKPYLPDNLDPKNCWIDDHVDIAIGGNSKTAHPDEVKTFLKWLTSQEFAQAFADNQPGFFPLADYKIDIKDPLAAQFLSWRQQCKSSIRIFYQFLSRWDPGATQVMTDHVYLMVQGKETPDQVAKTIQDGLDKSYKAMPAAK
jgi:raffinose/stachyose/melibiose transport system substrate-binding protein